MISPLKSEVTVDPEGIGYSAFLPDSPGRVVELLNAPTQQMIKAIRASTAFAWCAAGPYGRIVDAANNGSHPCRSACLALRDALLAGLDVHIERSDVSGMIDALVATNVFTPGESTSLLAIGMQPASRAEVLGFGYVTEAQLHTAMET